MASSNNSNVYSGKNARILVAGLVVGFAQGVSWTEDYGVQPVTAIGSFPVLEHQPTVYSGSGSLQKWAIRTESNSALLNVTPDDVLNADVIELEVYDEVSGQAIRVLEGVTFGGSTGGINAGQLASETHPFRYVNARTV